MDVNYDVFISYSRRDYKDEHNRIIQGNIVSQIKDLFDANNISYWFDEDGVYSGDAFAPAIARNIKSSSVFLFISSENSNISEWTSNEIATAHTYKKKIIPFKYDNSIYNDSVIIYIARLDYIDYPSNPEKSLQRLLLSVQTYLKEEHAKKEKERLEAERRLKAEISRQERAEKIKGIHDELEKLENRKIELKKEILEKEKSLIDLRNEIRIVETNISDLKEKETFIIGKDTQKNDAVETSTQQYTIKSNANGVDSKPDFFVSRWIELKSSVALKHWSVNTIYVVTLITCLLAFPIILLVAPEFKGAVIAMRSFSLATLASAFGLYHMLKSIRYGVWMTLIPYTLFLLLLGIRNIFVLQHEGIFLMLIILSICFYIICLLPLSIRKKKQSAWSTMKRLPLNFKSISLWAYVACIVLMIVHTISRL